MSTPIRFWLNNREVETRVPPGMPVLDFLRHRVELMGTKEGCKEGDCGACTVLIGELVGDSVRYKPVTSCLVPVGELHGKHLITVEGLNMEHLTVVQEAIVTEGATQCGFCTPGIVVSLTYGLMEKGPDFSDTDVKYVLSGHLCRCTGYASLLRAGKFIQQKASSLKKHGDQSTHIQALINQGMLPAYFADIPEKLRRIPHRSPHDDKQVPTVFIAGGTDLYVQRGEELSEENIALLNLHPEMKGISRKGNTIHVGALTTFEDFAEHPVIRQAIPRIKDYMLLNASLQVRNRATIGGNVVNASPIADMVIFLLAMDAEVVLWESTTSWKKEKKQRRVALRNFYKGYKQLDKSPTEVVAEIVFPWPIKDELIHFEKVSKRRHLDIASVNSAIRILVANNIIEHVHLSVGGVAPVPLYMRRTCEYLTGKPLNTDTLTGALDAAQQEISPISDIRGSADYKRLLTRNLIIAHFTELFPETFSVQELVEEKT